MTKAVYDDFAKEYQDSKQLPFRTYAEAPLLTRLLGDMRGLAILDLACGEGIYSRKLKGLGATRVVGVDISPEMIALARKNPQDGIEYKVGDALTLGQVGTFDLVLGSYLLNYARSEEELMGFCRTIAANLKPGGRFVGMNDNPANLVENYPRYRPYGFTKASPIPRVPGSPVTYTFFNADGSHFSFDNYYHAPETYQATFRKAGFKSFTWHKLIATEEGVKKLGQDHWKLFHDDPPLIGIEAQF